MGDQPYKERIDPTDPGPIETRPVVKSWDPTEAAATPSAPVNVGAAYDIGAYRSPAGRRGGSPVLRLLIVVLSVIGLLLGFVFVFFGVDAMLVLGASLLVAVVVLMLVSRYAGR